MSPSLCVYRSCQNLRRLPCTRVNLVSPLVSPMCSTPHMPTALYDIWRWRLASPALPTAVLRPPHPHSRLVARVCRAHAAVPLLSVYIGLLLSDRTDTSRPDTYQKYKCDKMIDVSDSVLFLLLNPLRHRIETASLGMRCRLRPRPMLGCRSLARAAAWQDCCPHPFLTLTGRTSTISTVGVMKQLDA